jgi:uncharacterized protein (DUF58 family)
VSAAARRPFALVPRRRFVGVRFGQHRSPRRGPGDEVAGARPYRPGDRRTWIDWRASARLSAARGSDEFVVREFFADTAPRVAIAVDRRPRMQLYPPPFPWLDKGAAIEAAVEAIGRAAVAEAGDLAYVEHPRWIAPAPAASVLSLLRASGATAGPVRSDALARSLEHLVRRASSFPAGTFVFVVSDFVDAAPPQVWVELRALGWDVVPVVVQDPIWEQSFPEVGGVLLSVSDPETGEQQDIALSRREAHGRAAANEERLRGILDGFARLGFDAIQLGSSDPVEIAMRFERWAERRRRLRRRSA